MFHLLTPRLELRQWLDSDYQPFASLNADPQVMEYFPEALNSDQSNELMDKLRDQIATRGWGFWAVTERTTNNLIGFTGINPTEDTPKGSAVEIGWRLAHEFWGKGFATEAANASLLFAFEVLNLPEVISFTSLTNRRSQAVMQRLGMAQNDANFMHPKVPTDSPLQEHVLFSITADDFQSQTAVEIIRNN